MPSRTSLLGASAVGLLIEPPLVGSANPAMPTVVRQDPRSPAATNIGRATYSEKERRPQVLDALREAVGQAADFGPRGRFKPPNSLRVGLDQVPSGVPQVELDAVAWELVEVVAERRAVEAAAPRRLCVDGVQIVDADREVMVGRDVAGTLEQVQLSASDSQPLNGKAEVRGREPLNCEELVVEVDRLGQVDRAH